MRGSTAGIGESLKGSSRLHDFWLSFLDTTFASLVVAPAVVGYWRGTWDLMPFYVYPDDPFMSSVVSLCIGFFGHVAFCLGQHQFAAYFHPDKHRLVYYVLSRVYTAIFGFVCVNSWRGAWQLVDIYTELEFYSVLATTLVSSVALAAMKTLRNISAPPFAVATDTVRDYFDVPTMFKLSSSRETSLYVLDCLFSVFVVGSLVVFVWRGAWVLLDLLVFPTDPQWSAWGSLVLGYGIVVATFSLQSAMRWACSRLQGCWRVLVADLFLFFSFVGTVNVWRSVWHLLDIYFIPENRLLSNWITHSCCLLLLVLLNCSNSVLVRGVYIDAEEPAGKCVVFPCYYLRLFFQKERTKKLQKTLKSTRINDREREIDKMITVPILEKDNLNCNNVIVIANGQDEKIMQ